MGRIALNDLAKQRQKHSNRIPHWINRKEEVSPSWITTPGVGTWIQTSPGLYQQAQQLGQYTTSATSTPYGMGYALGTAAQQFGGV